MRKLRATFFLARLPTLVAVTLGQLGSLAASSSWLSLLGTLVGSTVVVNRYFANFSFLMPRVLAVFGIASLCWFVNALVASVARRLEARVYISSYNRNLLVALSQLVCTAASLLYALSAFGLQNWSLVLPLGALLALSCKDILLNTAAGVFLLLNQPFQFHDRITIATPLHSTPFSGTLLSNDIWYTTLVLDEVDSTEGADGTESAQPSKSTMCIPNAVFLLHPFRVERKQQSRTDTKAHINAPAHLDEETLTS